MMSQKDRILELVKKGIISTEEGISLLEKMDEEQESIVQPKVVDPTLPKADKATDVEEDLLSNLATASEKEAKEETFLEDHAIEEEETEEGQETNFDKDKFKADLSQAFDQISESIKEFGKQAQPYSKEIGKSVKDIFTSLTDAVKNNVDLKEVNIKVPSLAKREFATTFRFPAEDLTIIDVENLNGGIKILPFPNDEIKVDVTGYVAGAKDEDPVNYFTQTATIDAKDGKLTINSTKRINVKADYTIFLPENVIYDYLSIKTTNGALSLSSIKAQDVYLKNVNGSINVDQVDLTMLEVKNVNGSIQVEDSSMRDAAVEGVNGTVIFRGKPESLRISTMNGSLRVTLEGDDLKKVIASSVSGSVKLALPKGIGLDLDAETMRGTVKSRLLDTQVVHQTERTLSLKRFAENVAVVSAENKNGSIYLKDVD